MTEKIRILELGSGVSAAYAAKLLADQGADVVKVEPGSGDRTRFLGPFKNKDPDPDSSGLFLALNSNKRGACLDFASNQGRRQLRKLINWADILVHNYSRLQALELGLDPVTIEAERPDLVVLSITPFGITGPYCDHKAEELTISNAGGWAGVCPVTHTDDELPPLKTHGKPCGMMAGIAGALTALAVYQDKLRSGVGEYIDLSEQEYIATILEAGIPTYSYKDEIARRYGQRTLIPWRIFQTRDDPIFLLCVEHDQWQRLIEFMGNPDWATADIFADYEGRTENQDIIHTMVQEFISEWTQTDFFHEAQKYRISVAPLLNFEQIASNQHLRDRGFFDTIVHPKLGPLECLASPAITASAGRANIRRPAPSLGQHTEEVMSGSEPRQSDSPESPVQTPLHGVRVLDLTWAWAGPFCSMNLAHLGAEVIRLESEARPDFYRRLGPFSPDMEPGLNRAGHFNQWNQGKKSVAVDLSQPTGIEIVKEFVASSDVVVQNFGTGVLDRLNLGYDVLKEINPRIILASISGYGQSGPYSKYMAYGPAIGAVTGLSVATGYIGGEPEELGISLPDPTAGITAAFAIVAALDNRRRTGKGDHIDVSMWESTATLGTEAWMQYSLTGTQPERQGNRDLMMSPHGTFRCAGEDEWVSIACATDAEWALLGGLIDAPLVDDARFRTLADRKANEDLLEKIIGDWTRDRNRWEITTQLQQQGIAAFPGMTCQDIVEDKHLNARGFIERLEHPEVGARAHTGIPWHLRRRSNGVKAAAPCLGADTDSVLSQTLGFSSDKIARLREENILQ
jgi:crotonobetainyl-CoA:carnitine CoA-transferase CaiB-like acyl-CoA transferase